MDGRIGYLDHALASPTLSAQVVDTAIWHVNADQPRAFDYNDEVLDASERFFERKPSLTPLYEPGPARFSDADPVIVGLDLGDS